MPLLSIFGFILATVMGVTLGLIGTGGSMLTVPILVYLFHVKPSIATGYSLLVVGCTAAVGTFGYWRQRVICVRQTVLFVLPSTIMILLTRRFILPSIPDPVVHIHGLFLSKPTFIMSLFALLMFLTGYLTLRPAKIPSEEEAFYPRDHVLKLTVTSATVGLLAGLVGAGGGFLIIPALMTWFRLSMKEAIGTSLAVIMVNSLIGFQGDLLVGIQIDWLILGPFLGLAILGMLLGIQLNQYIDGLMLKRGFGYFMLCLGSMILAVEAFELLH